MEAPTPTPPRYRDWPGVGAQYTIPEPRHTEENNNNNKKSASPSAYSSSPRRRHRRGLIFEKAEAHERRSKNRERGSQDPSFAFQVIWSDAASTTRIETNDDKACVTKPSLKGLSFTLFTRSVLHSASSPFLSHLSSRESTPQPENVPFVFARRAPPPTEPVAHSCRGSCYPYPTSENASSFVFSSARKHPSKCQA